MGLNQVLEFLGVVNDELTFIGGKFVVRHMPKEGLAASQELLNVIAHIFGGKVHVVFPPRSLVSSKSARSETRHNPCGTSVITLEMVKAKTAVFLESLLLTHEKPLA